MLKEPGLGTLMRQAGKGVLPIWAERATTAEVQRYAQEGPPTQCLGTSKRSPKRGKEF